ncbi:MAG: hypothetical protein ABL911_01600 [Gallionella sp.]
MSPSLTRTALRAAGDGFGRLTVRSARLLLRTLGVQQKAISLAALLAISASALAITPANSPINNTATASYTVGTNNYSRAGSSLVNTTSCFAGGIKIDLLQHIPAARAASAPDAFNVAVQTSQFASGSATGAFVSQANPTLLNAAAPTVLPSTLLLTKLTDASGNPISAFSRNEPIFVRVESYDGNTNGAVKDTISITVSTSIGGDAEVIQLTETDISSGVFAGVIPTTFSLGTTATPYDGNINITAHNETIKAEFTHSNCGTGTIASSSSGLIDPYGIVFDSTTGAPVPGASIRMVDSAGASAVVYCDDGVTVLTQPVISGSITNCDTNPATISAGGFRFPLAPAGSYRLVITPPSGYVISTKPVASLPALVGTPAAAPVILGNPGTPATAGGSYGGLFTLWGPALKLDIPLDSSSAVLSIVKTAEKSVVSTGDFIPYTLTISSGSAITANIVDHPPVGFRYQKDSARLNGAAITDPVMAVDASTLTFNLNNVASPATIRYVLEVTSGARMGAAENTATAIGATTSNTARASVVVREDLFRNKTILIGRVIDGSCDDQVENDAIGLSNARVVMEDGTYALTDKEGRWHIDNVRAGTHVVQLDLDSLPKDYEVVACEKNTRFAGRSYSQFVNLHPGALWRADFHVQKKAPVALRLSQTLSTHTQNDLTIVSLAIVSSTEVTGYSATVMLPEGTVYVPGSAKLNGETIADPDSTFSALTFRSQARPSRWQDQYTIAVDGVGPRATLKSMMRYTTLGQAGKNLPVAQVDIVNHAPMSHGTSAEVLVEAADSRPAKATNDDDPSQLMEILPYDEVWLAAAQPSVEWLHPQESFHPNLPVMNMAVKHLPQQRLSMTVNGEPVSPLLFDGAKMNTARTVSLSTWRAVPVKEGDNKVELVVINANGSEASRTVRIIHFAATPDRVEFVAAQSRLIADGKTRPIIAVRFLDKDGVPVRRGINGDYLLNEPYRSYNKHEAITRNPLTGNLGGKPRFEIMSDGLAMIELEPTTQSGEAVLNFNFNDTRKQELRAWLEAGQRDWILVGFAEGTIGQKTLSGNIQALQDANADKELFDSNKLAFYAKGSIKGDFLLTLAYDTSKQTGNKLLKQAIDPTQYYTLYADAMQAGFDAASSSRLYVKLERKQFYAMFGDYDTDLTVTELSRYSRTLNGVKSAYKGEQFGYTAFASETAQAYLKDEIPGNGTSGVYKLSRGNLMINSDKIRIETRDRFQSQIIVSVQTLTRYLDYDLDYDKGTLTFREPINSRDNNLNPTYIVAEYESADPAESKITAGGRASFKPTPQVEVGATLIHDGTVGATGNLKGLDATVQLNEQTKLRGEIAATSQDRAGVANSGNAWLGEVKHHEAQWDANAYVRQQQSGFVLGQVGQQAASEVATRKMGVDGRLKLSDKTQLQAQAYQQTNLSNDTKNSVLEGRVENRFTDNLNAYLGARTAQDQRNPAAGGNSQSNQVISGASYITDNKKLTLHGAGEFTSGTAGSANMPNRATLGADYKLTEQTKMFAEQEFARGENIAANTSRFGLRTQPWTGGEMSASVGGNTSNDSERIYSNLGLVQRWQINEHWQTDFSLDRTHTLKNTASSLNLDTPLASGSGGTTGLPSTSSDYTASAIGGAYSNELWGANGRIELRNATDNRQRNLQLGTQRSLDAGRNLAAGYTLRQANGLVANTRDTDLRLSYAHRPNDSRWVWFDRGDYITHSNQSAGLSINGKKWVNNLHVNYMPSRRTQISLQYGAKYVLENINNTEYKGYTDLFGTEIRHDLTQRWDIGAWASVMNSHNSGVRNYGLGASIGFKIIDNAWVAFGYNVRAVSDRDFSAASYRAKGPYLTLRMKVDQDTFKLNKGGEQTRPMTHE